MTAPEKDGGVFARLAAPLPESEISWRIDGKPVARDGKFVARFVAYIDAHTVRERLDSVCPGEWDAHLELLPSYTESDRNGVATGSVFAFKCRLKVLGVEREDVGQGTDYKNAATDAFKRAGVRFGIGHELYDYEQNWVQVDGDGKFAKAVEDPAAAYKRRTARRGGGGSGAEKGTSGAPRGGGDPAEVARADGKEPPTRSSRAAPAPRAATPPNGTAAIPTCCPKCEGELYDNRAKKASGAFKSSAPDFKCKDRSCEHPIWLDAKKASGKGKQGFNFGDELPGEFDESQSYEDEVPF